MTPKASPLPVAAVSETAGFRRQWHQAQTNDYERHNGPTKSRSTTDQSRPQMTPKAIPLPVAAVSETAGFRRKWHQAQTNDHGRHNRPTKSRSTTQQSRATSP
jgi:flagellar basal body rod protein FlgF